MRRRDLLAVGGFALSGFGGCLARSGDSPSGTTQEATTELSTTAEPTPSGECGPAATPLSEQFTEDTGSDPACFEGAMADIAIQNEREEAIELAIDVVGDDGSVVEESYDLQPGERTIERSVLPAHDEHKAHVSIDGEAVASGKWETPSCYRHAIAVIPVHVAFGLVAPLEGPGDTQHDCYAGDDASLSIYNGEEPQTGTIRVVDHCTESTTGESFDLESDETEHFRGLLVSGGVYDVTIDVDGGGSDTYEFDGQCWGLTAAIDADGEVSIRQVFID